MKEAILILITVSFSFCIGFSFGSSFSDKTLKKIEKIEMITDNIESQLKILTPPPEFFALPVVRRP
jgi:hypothetical protein